MCFIYVIWFLPQAASSFAFDVVFRPITYFISSAIDSVNIEDAKTPSTTRFYTIGRIIYGRHKSPLEIKKTAAINLKPLVNYLRKFYFYL